VEIQEVDTKLAYVHGPEGDDKRGGKNDEEPAQQSIVEKKEATEANESL